MRPLWDGTSPANHREFLLSVLSRWREQRSARATVPGGATRNHADRARADEHQAWESNDAARFIEIPDPRNAGRLRGLYHRWWLEPLDAHPTSVSSTVLTEAEITRADASTAYETIERLRPWYLSLIWTRGASCERAVYVDGMWLGGLDKLRGISSASVWQIRSLDAPEATTRFGSGHCAGAIVVVTQGGR